MTEQHPKTEPAANSEDEVIDLSKLKQKVKGLFSKKKTEHHQPKTKPHPGHAQKAEAEESLSLDIKEIKSAAKRHAKWLIPLVCILIAVSMSVYLRTMPQRMPIADQWAGNVVTNYYQDQIQQQINQQYPYLPEQNKQALVDKEWKKVQEQNKDDLQVQTKALSEQYRNQFKDDNGTLYLLGIDPYFYYIQSAYILKNGYPGTSLKDGKIWNDYRLAPTGREAEWNFHTWFGAAWHRFLNLFGNFPLMYTFFFVGTIFSALTVIPGFFIGKKLSGNNIGGFFTAFLLAVSSFFVSRTTGESSDTDVHTVFFPVLITWLFLEALDAKEKKWKFAWMGAAGLATGIFAFAWTGRWYIATFLIATIVFDIGYKFVINWKTSKNSAQTIKSPVITQNAILLGVYILCAGLFVSLFTSFSQLIRIIIGPFQFLRLKAVAVTSFWPNIRTTVAELNVVSLSYVINTLGGNLLFILAIAGIIIVLLRKNEQGKRDPQIAFLLALWLGATLFGTSKGVRFILQVTPIFSIAVGAFLGLAWHYASRWISKELKLNKIVTNMLVFAILAILLISPAKAGYAQARNSVPNMNDAWYNTLTKIDNEAPQNVIITSWWDFGHWFEAVAQRPVTFDGGTQTPWGAYWVGRSLLINDEKATVGIVRMLNCGQNTAFDELDKVLNDTPKSIKLLNELVVVDKNAAIQRLKQAGLTDQEATAVVKYTHCDNPPEDFYITSEDMIGKAGVWGHFGDWDFTKAVMYQKASKLPREEAIAYLIKNFDLSADQAEQTYTEIKTTAADRWISPWPGYPSGVQRCDNVSAEELRCVGSVQGKSLAIKIKLTDYTASFEGNADVHPNSLVYVTPQGGIQEKTFPGTKVGFSIVLVPNGDKYLFFLTDPLQANSMFTKLYFLQGQGLRCFSKFSDVQNLNGGNIITWRVDYDCKQENNYFFAKSAK